MRRQEQEYDGGEGPQSWRDFDVQWEEFISLEYKTNKLKTSLSSLSSLSHAANGHHN